MEIWHNPRCSKSRTARELGLNEWPRERARWVAAMVAPPILIERPILVADDGRAVLGRPPEAIAAFLGS